MQACTVRVRHKGKFLMLERAADDPVQGWCMPGGKVEDGENLEKAAHRELYEESGIFAGLEDEDFSPMFSYKAKSDKYGLYVVHVWDTELVTEREIVLSHEHSAYRWCTLEEAKQLPLSGNTGVALDILALLDKCN